MSDTFPPSAEEPQNLESFNYDIPLAQLGFLWAKGLKYPNGDPIALVDCTTYIDPVERKVFIKVTNVRPTSQQLIRKL